MFVPQSVRHGLSKLLEGHYLGLAHDPVLQLGPLQDDHSVLQASVGHLVGAEGQVVIPNTEEEEENLTSVIPSQHTLSPVPKHKKKYIYKSDFFSPGIAFPP